MKRLVFLMIFLLTTTIFADSALVFKSGMNLGGESTGEDVGSALNYSIEYIQLSRYGMNFGFGITYEEEVEKDSGGNLGMKTIPVYGILRYGLNLEVSPYAVLRCGYIAPIDISGFSDKPDAGIYYAIGGGLEMKNMMIEFLYSSDLSEDIEYSKITVNFGYRFLFEY